MKRTALGHFILLCLIFCLSSCASLLTSTVLSANTYKKGFGKKAEQNLIGKITNNDSNPTRTQIISHGKQFEESVKSYEISLLSFDNTLLKGQMYENEGSSKYLIAMHGFRSNAKKVAQQGSYFYEWGYNVLTPDQRAHGKSGGKWIGLGYLDSKDLLCWINYIIQKDPNAQIVLFGQSMGAATVMMCCKNNLPQNVKCIIEDCGYSSAWNEFSFQIKSLLKINPFPLLNLMNFWSKVFAGYSFKEASSLDGLKNCKVPVLFIHGGKDNFVPVSMLYQNVNEIITSDYDNEFNLLIIDKAGHGQSLYTNPQLYLKTVKEFIETYTK